MSIKQHRVRLLELRRKVNELIECELALLDDEEIREAKETNSRPTFMEGAVKLVMPEKE